MVMLISIKYSKDTHTHILLCTQNTEAVLGNTQIYRPLHAYFRLQRQNAVRNVLLVSDGHINNAEMTIQAVKEARSHTRLFTCGVRLVNIPNIQVKIVYAIELSGYVVFFLVF